MEEKKNKTLTDSSHECHSPILENPSRQPKTANDAPLFDPPPSLPVLPPDIIGEILSRLPVKILIRFRCVSKSFKTLISDPYFIRTHLRKISSLPNKPNLDQKIVLNWDGNRTMLKTCSLYSIFSCSKTDAIDLFDHPLMTGGYECVTTCDGLVCLARKPDFVMVVNPCTRVINRLPALGFEKKMGMFDYGFGYDRKINDYKVVALFSNPEIGNIFKVCSMRSRCWRRIESFPCCVPIQSGKYVNGSLIWGVMLKSNAKSMWSIVSFDLSSETCEEVKQPDYGGDVSRSDEIVGVFNGCLCVMCNNIFKLCADIWVMKEHGKRDSWTKAISIPYINNCILFYKAPYNFIADNGEVLIKLNSAFSIYNPKYGAWRYSRISGLLSNFQIATGTYIESLVSPESEN